MRFVKEKIKQKMVERLVGVHDGHAVEIWQYPTTVVISINGTTVFLSRRQLKKFLERKA